MDLLIKGGTLVTATSTFKADIAVKDGKISAIGMNLKPGKNTEVVDAKGRMVLPGAIDGHTFSRLNLTSHCTLKLRNRWPTG